MKYVYNYWCLNSECEERDSQVKMDETEKDEVYCLHCGSKMKRLGRVCNVVGKFACMSLNERKAYLKKRSSKHFEKKLKESKDYLDRKAMKLEK